MKTLFLCLLVGSASIATAATQPHLVTPGKVIAQPTLTEPLGKEWSVPKGIWTPTNGVITAAQIPAQKHPAVLHLATSAAPMIVQCEFQIGDKQTLVVGCNSAKGHVGRVTITATTVAVAENSLIKATGKPSNHVLKQQAISLKPGQWQYLRVEYAGDKMAAWLNDTTLEGEHPFLATPKTIWFFAATDGIQIRKIRVTEGADASATAGK